MASQLNHSGYAHAKSLISGDKISDEAWSFTADDSTALGNSGKDNWFLDAADNTKSRYRYPFGKNGKVYRRALAAIRSRASQRDPQLYEAAGKLLQLINDKSNGLEGITHKSYGMMGGTEADPTNLISCDEGKREAVHIISSDDVDRDKEVMNISGIKRKNFAGNPVVMVNHNYELLPIGKSLWIKSTEDNGKQLLLAKTRFTDKTQMARDVFGLMQDKTLGACSIGFQSLSSSPPTQREIAARPELKHCKKIHRASDLTEYSVVGIPCNPEAVSLAVSKGISNATIDFLTGKYSNTQLAAEEIIEDLGHKRISTANLYKAIARRLEQIVIHVDHDRVLAEAMRRLSNR